MQEKEDMNGDVGSVDDVAEVLAALGHGLKVGDVMKYVPTENWPSEPLSGCFGVIGSFRGGNGTILVELLLPFAGTYLYRKWCPIETLESYTNMGFGPHEKRSWMEYQYVYDEPVGTPLEKWPHLLTLDQSSSS